VLYRFDFDDDLVFDDQIGSEPGVDADTLIDHRNGLLACRAETSAAQFVRQDRIVNGFQQARSERGVNAEGGVHNLFGDGVLVHLNPLQFLAKTPRRQERESFPGRFGPTGPAFDSIGRLTDDLVVNQNLCGRRPMETFAKLFQRFLVFVYHCFDRIVIQGYLPLLTRPEHIVHFFRDVHGQYPLTPQLLAKRTLAYRAWVEGFARNHEIPILRAEKGMRKEKCVQPYLQRMERRHRHGVYCIITSMEMGSTFQVRMPKFPTADPDYRIIRRVPSRYLHYYFYIRDPVIGPLAMCAGTYLPFQTTYYLNGHNFIEIELRNQGVTFRKDDNAFLATSDPQALQATADKLSATLIEKRLDYWTWLLGPKFSEKDRHAVNLRRAYSINQVQYCRNFIFKRHLPHPQNLRTLLRNGAVPFDGRQGGPGLRRPGEPASTRETA
jgi:hypothetical protein